LIPPSATHDLNGLTHVTLLVGLGIGALLTGNRHVARVEWMDPSAMASLPRLPGEAFFAQIRLELAQLSRHVASSAILSPITIASNQ
jgi:hypothetical protein